MASSMYSDAAGCNSMLIGFSHELGDLYNEGPWSSPPAMTTAMSSNLSYHHGMSMLNDSAGRGEAFPRTIPHRPSPETGSAGKFRRNSVPHPGSAAPADALCRPPTQPPDQSCQPRPQPGQPSALPTLSRGTAEVTAEMRERGPERKSADDAGSGQVSEYGSMVGDPQQVDRLRRHFSNPGLEETRQGSGGSAASGAETAPRVRTEASRVYFDADDDGSDSPSSSSSSSYWSSPSGTRAAQSPHTRYGSTMVGHSMSGLPSVLIPPSPNGTTSPGHGRVGGRTPVPAAAAVSRNDMSIPFLFTGDGSFGAFPSPPEEEDVGGLNASLMALQQSGVISEMGFSYGGQGSMSALPATKPGGPRPPSRRRSVNRASLSHAPTPVLQRQSSTAPSIVYSTFDSSMVGVGASAAELHRYGQSAGGKPTLETTIPSSMMYYYARSSSALNRSNTYAAAAAAAAALSPSRRPSTEPARHRDDDSDDAKSTDSSTSGVTSSSLSDGEEGPRRHSSFFDAGRENQLRRGAEAAAAREADAGSESPVQRNLFDLQSGASRTVKMRVLRGDFENSDASLDSRELAMALKRATATASATPTRQTPPVKGPAPLPAQASTSPQGITPNSDGSKAASGRSGAADAARHRPSNSAMMTIVRSGAPPGRSTASITMSSGWGTTQGPNASQQTVVNGWRLLSFRETDDMPLTNTEHVPHDGHRRKKKDKKKKDKKKKSRKEQRKAKEEEQDKAAAGEGDGGEHGNAAREIANTMMDAEPQRDGGATGIAASAPGHRLGSATVANKNATSSTAAVAPGSAATAAPPTPASRASSTDGGARHPQPPPPVSAKPALPPVLGAAQGRMQPARLSQRSASVVAKSRTVSPARPSVSAGEGRAEGNRSSREAERRAAASRSPTPVVSGRATSPAATPRATGRAASPIVSAAKKPAERFEKFKEAPLTSPSATVRRTTVRAAPKAKVLVNASRRVNLGAIETTATGVRRFRPNAGPRLKAVVPPSSARGAAGGPQRGSAMYTPQAGARLPPL